MNKLKARPDLMIILFIVLMAIIILTMAVASYASSAHLPYIQNY